MPRVKACDLNAISFASTALFDDDADDPIDDDGDYDGRREKDEGSGAWMMTLTMTTTTMVNRVGSAFQRRAREKFKSGSSFIARDV